MDYLGTCVLRTACYVVAFRFKPIRDQGHISATCTFEIFQENAESLKFGFSAFFSLMGLPRLVAYFDDHIAGLKTNPHGPEGLNAAIAGTLNYTEAYVFTDMEHNFSIQALLGELDQDGEGSFALRFMVRTPSGRSANGHLKWVHIGAQGSVSVAQIREFLASVLELTDKHREHFQQSLTEGQRRLREVAEFYGG